MPQSALWSFGYYGQLDIRLRNNFVLDKTICARYTTNHDVERHKQRGQAMNNLIDWKLELTLQERLTRRQAMAYFIDEAPLTLAVALAPWIGLLWLMH